MSAPPTTHPAADEDGFGLVELLIAMTILTVAIGALVTSFAASAVSLRRAGQRGTALTLADTQMEKYRTKTYTAVRIDGTLDAHDCAVTYLLGDRTLAVATISRDRASLQAELAMERQR